MATPDGKKEGGRVTPVSPGLMMRLTGAINGAWNGWFGPGTPMTPVAPEASRGRRFDYPMSVNMNAQARGDVGSTGHDSLRRMADPSQGGLDLLRLAIETRKNQMAAQPWSIRGRAKHDDGGPAARAIETALRRPDGSQTFRNWMRMLLEDHYVIDAPVIYYGNSTPARPLLEVMDGGTIKLLIDQNGRTPQPPLPAYQQILHGVAGDDYTTQDIGYYVFNPRSNRIYGCSHVEQVVGILAIALNRQLSVLDYFTEGTVPDAFIQVPESWNVETIRQFQEYFDSVLSGQLGERRKARFIPGGATPIFTKDQILKDEFDEWLARIVCFCFSLSPQALVRQMNRASADTAKQTAQEEGLEPEKLWFKDVMDDALERTGNHGLEWQWEDEEIADPVAKASVISLYVGKKAIATIQQGREMAGLPPATDEELAEIETMNAPVAAFGGETGDGSEGDPTDPPTGKGQKPASSATSAKKLMKRGGRSLRPG